MHYLKLILRRGSLLVISVKDEANAVSKSFLNVGIIFGASVYAGTQFDPIRQAYTLLMPMGVSARIWLDTPLLAQDAEGNNLPIDAATIPFITAGDETPVSLTVTPALVIAASYIPGIEPSDIASLFGSGFTDVPGVQMASSLPLPTEIGGTSVTVNGSSAPLFGVLSQNGQDQINFQVPHYPPQPGSDALVIVVNNNGKTQTFYSRDWESLGIFSTLGHLGGSPITLSSPAQPGEGIVIYWTGMYGNNFTVMVADGAPSPSSAPCVSYFDPQVRIGGLAVDVKSCSASPGLVGVGQLIVSVPPSLQSGTYNVLVSMDSVNGNAVQLPVQQP